MKDKEPRLEDLPMRADPEKVENLLKLVLSIPRSNPAILLHAGDDYCWMQYYMLKFLEMPTIIFIPPDINLDLGTIPTNFQIWKYKNKEELQKKVVEAVEAYKKKVEDEIKNKKSSPAA